MDEFYARMAILILTKCCKHFPKIIFAVFLFEFRKTAYIKIITIKFFILLKYKFYSTIYYICLIFSFY